MSTTNSFKIEEFRVLDLLKFPLAVLVVILHGHITETTVGETLYVYDNITVPLYSNISYLISEIIGFLALPTFFVISGYLFFKGLRNNEGCYNAELFVQKLKRRSKTLLVPYFLWNTIYLLLFLLGQAAFPELFSGSKMLIRDYKVIDFLNAFWRGGGNGPICAQLWFIRDLIIMIILSPIIFFCFRYIKTLPIILFGILWLVFGYTVSFEAWSFKSAFFFYGGGYFAFNNWSILDRMGKHKKMFFLCYLVLIITTMFCYNIDSLSCVVPYSSKVALLFGVPVVFCLGDMVVCKYSGKGNLTNSFLSSSNFFIFGYHLLPLYLIIKLLLKLLSPQSDWSILFVYTVSPIVTILLGLLILYVLKIYAKICICSYRRSIQIIFALVVG